MVETPSIFEAGKAFEDYRQDVYSWAYRILGSHHDTLDVIQDVCLRWLLQSRKNIPAYPRAWLRRTTVNRAIDLVRARKPQVSISDVANSGNLKLVVDSSARQSSDVVADAIYRLELRNAIVAALDSLSDTQRCVLVAKEYDGMTFLMIANELGIALSTVKTHYLRGVKGVRYYMKTHHKDMLLH